MQYIHRQQPEQWYGSWKYAAIFEYFFNYHGHFDGYGRGSFVARELWQHTERHWTQPIGNACVKIIIVSYQHTHTGRVWWQYANGAVYQLLAPPHNGSSCVQLYFKYHQKLNDPCNQYIISLVRHSYIRLSIYIYISIYACVCIRGLWPVGCRCADGVMDVSWKAIAIYNF